MGALSPLAVLEPRAGDGSTGPGRYTVSITGRLLNTDRMLKEFGARGLPVRTEQDAVERQLLQRTPRDVGRALEGDWGLAVRDHHDGSHWAVRDAIGLIELAWGLRDDGALVVGRPGAVAAALGRPPLDEAAISWWLATQTIPCPLSGWRGVHRLPVGHGVRVDADGTVEVFCWHSQPATDHSLGAPGAVRHAAHRIALALQPPTLRRWEEGACLLRGDDLDGLLGDLLLHCGGREVRPMELGQVAPGPLEALVVDGPQVDPRGPALLAAVQQDGHPLLIADGGAALMGVNEVLGAHRAAGVLGRLRGRTDTVAHHLRLRGGVEVSSWFSAPPSLAEVWARREGPRGWLELLAGPPPQVAHALDRLWWLREARLVTPGRVWATTGVEVGAPFAVPELEWVITEIPLRLHMLLSRPYAVARAVVSELGGISRVSAQSAWLDGGAHQRLDSVKEGLRGLLPPDTIDRIWNDDAVPDRLRWRLETLAAWHARWG